MAAALYVFNVVSCGSSDEPARPPRAGVADAVEAEGAAVAAVARQRRRRRQRGRRRRTCGDSASYDVIRTCSKTSDAARDRLTGNEFIFDVQTHVSMPLTPLDRKSAARASTRFHQADLRSERHHGRLPERHPEPRAISGIAHVEGNVRFGAIIDQLGGPRLIMHAQRRSGARTLRARLHGSDMASRFSGSARSRSIRMARRSGWTATRSAGRFIDAGRIGSGVRADRGTPWHQRWRAATRSAGSPGGRGARGQEVSERSNFLVYHSGWEPGGNENHRFDPQTGATRRNRSVDQGVWSKPASDRTGCVRRARLDLAQPDGHPADGGARARKAFAQVRGRGVAILYGTDCVFNGVPQSRSPRCARS